MANDEATSTVPATVTDSDAFRAVAAKYGVTPADIKAPQPTVTSKLNLDQLCTRTDPVLDGNGTAMPNIAGHSGPLMFLSAKEYSQDTMENFKTRYDNYVGFVTWTVFRPKAGGGDELVLTHGIPAEGPTDLMTHVSKLDPGNLFQVGMYNTSRGNRLFKPIPVQPA